MNTIDIIKKAHIFSDIERIHLKWLVDRSKLIALKKDEILFSDGDDADSFFLVVDGVLELIKSSSRGREQLIRRVKEAEIFAEAAVFSGALYPVTAISRAKTQVLSISKKSFVQFISKNPDVALKMLGSMSKLLRHLSDLVADLSLSSVKARLAQFLLQRSEIEKSLSFDLKIQKRELAFRLGTISETLSRNLRNLEDEGIIAMKGKKVVIKNKGSLESISNSR